MDAVDGVHDGGPVKRGANAALHVRWPGERERGRPPVPPSTPSATVGRDRTLPAASRRHLSVISAAHAWVADRVQGPVLKATSGPLRNVSRSSTWSESTGSSRSCSVRTCTGPSSAATGSSGSPVRPAGTIHRQRAARQGHGTRYQVAGGIADPALAEVCQPVWVGSISPLRGTRRRCDVRGRGWRRARSVGVPDRLRRPVRRSGRYQLGRPVPAWW